MVVGIHRSGLYFYSFAEKHNEQCSIIIIIICFGVQHTCGSSTVDSVLKPIVKRQYRYYQYQHRHYNINNFDIITKKKT